MATFYLDAPTLKEATAVFSDITLDTKAADGYYSDGAIYREQSSGVLLPDFPCPSCPLDCGTAVSASGLVVGYYELSYLMTAATGAIIVTFNPNNSPKGIAVEFGGVTYTEVVSSVGGAVSGANFSVIGKISEDCGVQGSVYQLTKFVYGAAAFNETEDTVTMNTSASDINLTEAAPGNAFLVIPKPAATPTALTVKIYLPCNSDFSFDINVDCASALTSCSVSVGSDSSTGLCDQSFVGTLYNYPINGAAGVPAVGDIMFKDANGAELADPGWYKVDLATDILINVNSYGIVIQSVDCGSEVYVSGSFIGEATLDVTFSIDSLE